LNKIIITGGSGFIGTKLYNSINDDKFKIISLDTKKNNDRSKNSNVIDLCDYSSVSALCLKYNPNVIIHCAGIAHQKLGSIKSDEYLQVNSIATENLAKAAITANPEVHFIFLSSISVYGEDNIKGSVSEECECKPSSDYANSKLDAEKRLIKLYDFGKLKKLDILRLTPVYDSEWSLNLDRRVFAPKKLAYIKFGSGEQEMSAISRENLVDFINYRLRKEEDNQTDEPFCNVINVCDEQPYKFVEMISVFRKSEYHPDKLVVRVPLSLVWFATRIAGVILRSKRRWLHSCYDKLAYSLVFDNKKILNTGLRTTHSLKYVFLRKLSLSSEVRFKNLYQK
jgi:nucleoside-diphosphate-sugar epimerase